LKKAGALATGRINESELTAQCRDFLSLLRDALSKGGVDVANAAYTPVREFLGDVSRSRALQGFLPRETAVFVFSLKRRLFNAMNRDKGLSPTALAQTVWAITLLLDELGSTPARFINKAARRSSFANRATSPSCLRLWSSCGTGCSVFQSSARSTANQVMMENLLQLIVDDGAAIAIRDITGVPTVDTLTAQHLLKTVAAARLMGADCIISGIRPQTAQTLVHLGVELNVASTRQPSLRLSPWPCDLLDVP
jgi:rsbT co-antagonist protein RsbR